MRALLDNTQELLGEIGRRGQRLGKLLTSWLASPVDDSLSTDIQTNQGRLGALYKDSFPTAFRPFRLGGADALLLIVGGIVNRKEMEREVILPLQQARLRQPPDAKQLMQEILPALSVKEVKDWTTVEHEYEDGHALLFWDGSATAVSIDVKSIPARTPSEPKAEVAVRGPQISFIEDLKSNIAMIRDRARTHRLKIWHRKFGELTRTEVALLYIDGVARDKIVEHAEEVLTGAEMTDVQLVTTVTGLLEERPFSIFPQLRVTERVDEATRDLLEGRVLVLVNGDPTVAIYPSTLGDFYRTMQDYMMTAWDASYTRIIRAGALLVTLYLPALYVALTTINPDLLPTRFAIVVAGSREGVPFAPVAEVVLMFFIIEVLREAALRMPQQMGSTLGTVGAIVVGTALVKAGIVSDLMIVIGTLTAVAAFTSPSYEMTSVWRILMWPMVAAAAFFGIVGIIALSFVILAAMASLEVGGMPYLAPLVPALGEDVQDTLVRWPVRTLDPQAATRRGMPATQRLAKLATRHPRNRS